MNTVCTSLNLKPFSTKRRAAHCNTDIQTKTGHTIHFSTAKMQQLLSKEKKKKPLFLNTGIDAVLI